MHAVAFGTVAGPEQLTISELRWAASARRAMCSISRRMKALSDRPWSSARHRDIPAVPTAANRDGVCAAAARPQAQLLSHFSLSLGELRAGPWQRPSARRVVELVLISPGRRIRREVAAEALFPQLAATEASNALRKALSLARSALSALGEEAGRLLSADRDRIWASPEIAVDSEAHQGSLRSALGLPSGHERDEALSAALGEEGTLLEDEPFADWALRPRRPSKLYAMRLTCAWPGTVPKALAVRRLTASSRHGKPAFPRRHLRGGGHRFGPGVCGSGPPLVGGGYVPALPRSSERAGLASVARPR